jgi:hypothetical protein
MLIGIRRYHCSSLVVAFRLQGERVDNRISAAVALVKFVDVTDNRRLKHASLIGRETIQRINIFDAEFFSDVVVADVVIFRIDRLNFRCRIC